MNLYNRDEVADLIATAPTTDVFQSSFADNCNALISQQEAGQVVNVIEYLIQQNLPACVAMPTVLEDATAQFANFLIWAFPLGGTVLLPVSLNYRCEVTGANGEAPVLESGQFVGGAGAVFFNISAATIDMGVMSSSTANCVIAWNASEETKRVMVGVKSYTDVVHTEVPFPM